MNPHPHIIAHVFTLDARDSTAGPAARLVHLALAALANEHGHAETTIHTLEHMTGLLPIAIRATLGHNHADQVLFPATITLTADDIVTADLLPPRALAAVDEPIGA